MISAFIVLMEMFFSRGAGVLCLLDAGAVLGEQAMEAKARRKRIVPSNGFTGFLLIFSSLLLLVALNQNFGAALYQFYLHLFRF